MAGQGTVPMRWYGEYLWRAELPPDVTVATLCAADAAGNETCLVVETLKATPTVLTRTP